jgi:archaetidylserine synthase
MLKLVHLPDIISILNGLFGMNAIFFLLFEFNVFSPIRVHIAFSFILIGLLADGLDGVVARRYQKGELGEYLEAMADMTTMGIAPTVYIVYIVMNLNMNYQYNDILSIVIWGSLLFYLCSTFIRLSSFHPLKNKDVFIGLPASAATMFLLSISLLTNSVFVLIGSILVISLLMIMPLSFPKPTIIMNVITVVIILFTILLGLIFQVMYLFLLISVVLYITGGQLYIYFHKKKRVNI